MKIDLKGKVERKGQVNFVACFKDSEDIYRTVLDNICILLSQSNRQEDISWNKELESSFGSREVRLIKHGDRQTSEMLNSQKYVFDDLNMHWCIMWAGPEIHFI